MVSRFQHGMSVKQMARPLSFTPTRDSASGSWLNFGVPIFICIDCSHNAIWNGVAISVQEPLSKSECLIISKFVLARSSRYGTNQSIGAIMH